MTPATVLSSIPHRPPFLFVDNVVELDENRILATRFVDPKSDFFRGHYPDHPVMPGVLICECCFQAGALLIAHRQGVAANAGAIPVLTRITDARFRRIVKPGETLDLEVTLDDEVDNAYYLTGRASVGGANVLRVGFACMLAPPEAAP
jgi:3-hydroxyacyl-[acyl-carrier-protein] dehydratase